MSNEMVKHEDLDLPISNIPEAQLAKMSERAYLPFIKIASSDKEMATHKPGTWLLCKDATSKRDCGKPLEVLVIAARPLACHTTLTGIDRYYDMASKEYQMVKDLSEKPNHMGDWWGTDYLLWIRSQRAWATWHASSETHRQRADVLTGILQQWALDRRNKKLAIEKATASGDQAAVAAAQAIVVPNPQASLGTELVFYKRYNSNKWAATLAPITTPFSEVPAFEEIRERSLKFQNPPVAEKEELNTAGADAPASTRG
jgi:hypothetical protein